MMTSQNNATRGPIQSGTSVGSYVIQRFIGQGGMATVYEAINQDIGKKVALKILNIDLAQQPDMAQRFVNEARSASKVAHPGLISIFDCGKTGAGIYYIAMELLEGLSLERYIESRGHLGNEECIAFGRQTASALAAVHRHGVVHREQKQCLNVQ
ncbi:MAG: serine/threonine protein kinase [Myxococcales bacterium]|nr:serine/threonine protein kinase [Myxococcales bacterium]